MERSIDAELRLLQDEILSMGGCVESALEHAASALLQRQIDRLAQVHELEKKINFSHIKVDEMCLKLLARQSPLAKDLRLILAMIKINADLERMGDQVVNISHNCERNLNEPPLKPLKDLQPMMDQVRLMVRGALDALVNRDGLLAREILGRDDIVDAYKNQIFRELITQMIGDPSIIERALNLILIARNLERIGDHATNIAEDVIFALTGEDIRHGHGGEKSDAK